MQLNLKKVIDLSLVGLLSIGVLGACGQETTVSTSTNDKVQESIEKTGDSSRIEKDEKEEKKSKFGSRSNPIPFQTVAKVKDELYNDKGDSFPIGIELTVLEVVRGDEAFQMLQTMNEFNEASPEGYEWVLAKTLVKLSESDTKDSAFLIDGIMNFSMVSENGDIYSGEIVGTTEPDFSFEMYVGNEKEGYIADLVKIGEKAQLRYEGMNEQVFLNLQ